LISIEESFAEGNSVLHRLDPRIRVFFACLFSLLIALLESFTALLPAAAAALFMVILTGLDLKAVIKRLTVIAGFLILIWLMLPMTFEGEKIAQLGVIFLYRQGIELAARISLKSIAILLVFVSLVATMTVNTLAHVMYFFRIPAKLVFLLIITYRYIFVIGAEYNRLRTAMRIRCFKSTTSMHSIRSISCLIGMLFVRSSLRAKRVEQAMRLRGFNGRFYSLEDFHDYRKTAWITAVMLLLFVVLLYFEWFFK
jgi:cobalt/nickel transport system permease protein